MKTLNRFIFGLMSVCVMALSACTDEAPTDDFGQSPAVPGEGVYFPKDIKTSYTLTAEDPDAEKASGTFTIPVQRTAEGPAATAEVKVEMDAAATAVLTVAPTVQFAEGETESTLEVKYKDAVRGTKYKFSITFTDGTEYAYSTQTFLAEYPLPEVWEVVSEDAVFIDQIFSPFGVSDIMFEEVVVEKLKDKNVFRFQSVYTNYYFTGIGLPGILPDDYEIPYIILDGETHTKKPEDGSPVPLEQALWYIPSTALGFQISQTVDFKHDPSWNTFGSFAYNLSSGGVGLTEEDYPLGAYNKKKEMFDLGVCYLHLTEGYIDISNFQLWLNPAKMEVDYDRDYAPWAPIEEATGIFESGILEEKYVATLDKGTSSEGEDPIFRLNSLYAEGVNIAFFHNKTTNTVRVPKKQESGLESFGNPVYMDVKKATYDTETQIYTFEAEFYLIDSETGKKTATLATTTERFREGYLPQIEDYVGEYNFTQKEKNSQTGAVEDVDYTVNITQVDEETLAVKGLLPVSGYDDTTLLTYNSANGSLQWETQAMPNYGPYQIQAMFVGEKYYLPNNIMIGGFDDDGNLTFTDHKSNEYSTASYGFAVIESGQIAGLLHQITVFTWTRSEKVPMTPAALHRTYRTELNIKGTPVAAPKGTNTLRVENLDREIIIPLRPIE